LAKAVHQLLYLFTVELRDFGAAAGALADHCADTWLEPVLRKARPDGSVEASLLAARILLMRRRARIAPVSAAPVFAFALQLRAETIRLRHLIWRIQLTGPTPVAARIVTT